MAVVLGRTAVRGLLAARRLPHPVATYCGLLRLARCPLETPTTMTPVTTVPRLHNQPARRKSKGGGRKRPSAASRPDDSDDGEDTDVEDGQTDGLDLEDDRHSKLIRTTVSSPRADLLLKAGLGIARNKVEVLFYESKIRVNGRRLLKKSSPVEAGDELDVVRGPSPTNPDHLVVSRVEVLSMAPKGDSVAVALRRHRSLVIENYDDRATAA